jgi:hypothetical protein
MVVRCHPRDFGAKASSFLFSFSLSTFDDTRRTATPRRDGHFRCLYRGINTLD